MLKRHNTETICKSHFVRVVSNLITVFRGMCILRGLGGGKGRKEGGAFGNMAGFCTVCR